MGRDGCGDDDGPLDRIMIAKNAVWYANVSRRYEMVQGRERTYVRNAGVSNDRLRSMRRCAQKNTAPAELALDRMISCDVSGLDCTGRDGMAFCETGVAEVDVYEMNTVLRKEDMTFWRSERLDEVWITRAKVLWRSRERLPK